MRQSNSFAILPLTVEYDPYLWLKRTLDCLLFVLELIEKTFVFFYQRYNSIMEKIINWILPSWVTPNGISYFRAGLAIPVLLLLFAGLKFQSFWLYVFAAYLDSVDGLLARSRKLLTDLGAVVDALADKGYTLIILIPVVCLLNYKEVGLFFLILHLVSLFSIAPVEIYLGIVRWQDYKQSLVEKTKKLALRAGPSGKIKFILEACGVGAYLKGYPDPSGFYCLLGAILILASSPFAFRSLFTKLHARL